jgi:hypothetical protein
MQDTDRSVIAAREDFRLADVVTLAAGWGKRPALSSGAVTVSYGELAVRAWRVATGLR